MLVQDNQILDCCQHPGALMWSLLDSESSFMVIVGIIENGKRKILGACAEFRSSPGGRVFYLTSEADGYMRQVGKTGSVDILRERITLLYRAKKLSDPFNFSRISLWEGN